LFYEPEIPFQYTVAKSNSTIENIGKYLTEILVFWLKLPATRVYDIFLCHVLFFDYFPVVYFADRLPNAAALQALRDLITCSIGLSRLMSNYTLLGHRQAKDTLCPGEALYKEITTWPHWKPNPSPRMYEKASTNAAVRQDSQFVLVNSPLAIIILTLYSKWFSKF
jgi:hypothetical protein